MVAPLVPPGGAPVPAAATPGKQPAAHVAAAAATAAAVRPQTVRSVTATGKADRSHGSRRGTETAEAVDPEAQAARARTQRRSIDLEV